MIVINLIIGFTIPAIDNSAHIGGLLAGAVLAADRSVSETRHGAKPGYSRQRRWRCCFWPLSVFIEVATHYDGPRLSVRNLSLGLTQFGGASSSNAGIHRRAERRPERIRKFGRVSSSSDKPNPDSGKARHDQSDRQASNDSFTAPRSRTS